MAVFFFSCQQKENKSAPISNESVVAKPIKEENKENKQIGDTIIMNFKDEKGLFTSEGTLDSIHSKVYVKFKNDSLGELKAVIIPEVGKGNIRFNQIIFPDNTSDGPFGMDLKIPLKQKGNYIIVVGHSLMADNPYFGNFKIQIEN